MGAAVDQRRQLRNHNADYSVSTRLPTSNEEALPHAKALNPQVGLSVVEGTAPVACAQFWYEAGRVAWSAKAERAARSLLVACCKTLSTARSGAYCPICNWYCHGILVSRSLACTSISLEAASE